MRHGWQISVRAHVQYQVHADDDVEQEVTVEKPVACNRNKSGYTKWHEEVPPPTTQSRDPVAPLKVDPLTLRTIVSPL